jgi:LmbE family N-acetylglucosaminyl deacetylase
MRSWGLVDGAELTRVVIVSPHLDDAVLGCGRFMATHPGCVVLTVYAGAPARYPDPMTHWDDIAGFRSGDDVLGDRRAEDDAALAVLGASPRRLDFVEHQYLDRPDWVGGATTAPVLETTLRELAPTAVIVPFGLANPDHDATHDACMRVREAFPDPTWLLYEDFGYKHIPGLLAWRVSTLFRRGVWPTPVAVPVDPTGDRKRRALDCYRSQLLALEADWQLGPKLVAPRRPRGGSDSRPPESRPAVSAVESALDRREWEGP